MLSNTNFDLILQRHMVMYYLEYNKVISRLQCPRLAVASAYAEHDVIEPVDCVFVGIELSQRLDEKLISEPKAESSGRTLPRKGTRNTINV